MELNRDRPERGVADGVSWAIHPPLDAGDNLSLLETFAGQWQTVLSARELCEGRLMVSPLTLRARITPGAGTIPTAVPPDELPPEVDVRQMSLFGAVWTLGSIASLSRKPLLRSVTCFETTGWLGVMEWSDRPRLAHRFVSRPGWVFPMYFVFALLAGHDECRPWAVDRSDHAGLFIRRGAAPEAVRLLVANCTRDVLELTLPTWFKTERTLVLDHTNAVAFMREPEALLGRGWVAGERDQLALEPYAVAALDGIERRG